MPIAQSPIRLTFDKVKTSRTKPNSNLSLISYETAVVLGAFCFDNTSKQPICSPKVLNISMSPPECRRGCGVAR